APRLGGAVERVDRARLAECVGAAEERRLDAAYGPAEIVALESVPIGALDREPLAIVPPPEVDARLPAAPRAGQVQAAVRADDLKPLARRQVERAVELRGDVAGEDERAREAQVDAGRRLDPVRRRRL